MQKSESLDGFVEGGESVGELSNMLVTLRCVRGEGVGVDVGGGVEVD